MKAAVKDNCLAPFTAASAHLCYSQELTPTVEGSRLHVQGRRRKVPDAGLSQGLEKSIQLLVHVGKRGRISLSNFSEKLRVPQHLKGNNCKTKNGRKFIKYYAWY